MSDPLPHPHPAPYPLNYAQVGMTLPSLGLFDGESTHRVLQWQLLVFYAAATIYFWTPPPLAIQKPNQTSIEGTPPGILTIKTATYSIA
jgi:hypothetical protein